MVLCKQLLLPTEPGGAPPSQDCGALPSVTPRSSRVPTWGPAHPTHPQEAPPWVTVSPAQGHTPQHTAAALGHKSAQGHPKVFPTQDLPLPSHCSSSLTQCGAQHPGASHGEPECLEEQQGQLQAGLGAAAALQLAPCSPFHEFSPISPCPGHTGAGVSTGADPKAHHRVG